MEPTTQKTLERVVSQRAMQMGNSFPCQFCVVGFLSGVCLTYFFLAALTSSGNVEFSGVPFSIPSGGIIPQNSTTTTINMSPNQEYSPLPKDTARRMNAQKSDEWRYNERVLMLYSAWSAMLNESVEDNGEHLNNAGRQSPSRTPEAPHLENCKLSAQVNERLDSVRENETFPIWANWKGLIGLELLHQTSKLDATQRRLKERAKLQGAYPPWIVGSDEDNFPLTRRVQHDIWIHQHPLNCHDPRVRFLVADWETLPGFGIGAQLAGMAGLLAIAINEQRVLVINYFNRADHDGCEGLLRSRWSCYFFPETSIECRDRALELMTRKEAWYNEIVTGKHNYSSKEIWSGHVPRIWGNPWLHLQPTTEINGSLVRHHRKMDRRWWRAQAVRYLMRFQSEYTCGLLNVARHTAFGLQAAKMVLESLFEESPEVRKPSRGRKALDSSMGSAVSIVSSSDLEEHSKLQSSSQYLEQGGRIDNAVSEVENERPAEVGSASVYPASVDLKSNISDTAKSLDGEEIHKLRPSPETSQAVMNSPLSDMEQFVWSNHKPWIPRPLLSMHVRMGDKACEMKVVEFEEYMRLASRIRKRFPNLNSIWLSTEMQEVIDKSRSYPNWNFYYTNVTRQLGNITMASYEASLGRETSTNYPFVNFLMATDADFFIGALGSTWCFLIDGMRNTGGKVMAGYLSVNRDRFW